MIKQILDTKQLEMIAGGMSSASISLTATDSATTEPVVMITSNITGNGSGSISVNTDTPASTAPRETGTRTRSFSSSTTTTRTTGSANSASTSAERFAAFRARIAALRAG